MLGKIENGVFKTAPKKIMFDKKTVFNPTDETLEKLGYKKVVEMDCPDDGQHYTAEYVEDNDVIRQSWSTSQYWQTVDYGEAVENEIRKKYSVSAEFAILRQRDEKPEEYATYYAYCEECKAYVKSKKNLA